MGQHFQLEFTDKKIAILRFKNTSLEMNVLTEDVLRELDTYLDDFKGNKEVAGVVIISDRKDQFIVGANIDEIAAFSTMNQAANGATILQGIFNKLANLGVPTVAAIHGNCLGGGLEMSLACSWRVASNGNTTKLALPEIQLGLIPGAGGTQRLPRLIGIKSALDMILTGRRVDSQKAQKLGLVDAVVPLDRLLYTALDFASKKGTKPTSNAKGLTQNLTVWATEGNPIGRKVMYSAAKKMVDEKTKGFYPASYRALDAVFEGIETSLTQGLKLEANFFGELAMTKESQSLIHLYYATTAVKKNPYKEQVKSRFNNVTAKCVGVVGAGFMGTGIANVCSENNLLVMLSDPSKESISKSLHSTRKYFLKKVESKKMKLFELNQALARISPGLNTNNFQLTDITIEAAPEVLSLKQNILASLEENAPQNWVFATNTSAIPVEQIAQNSKDKSRVVGMHFFSPVEKMPLLEIVRTNDSADWAVGRAFELGSTLGKTMIVVKDGPGFYTTRALAFFLAEAAMLVQEGQSIEEIDNALSSFGFPIGPINLIDEVGIDVGAHVLETMASAFPSRIKMPHGFDKITNSGRLGRKNGKGFYSYEEGHKQGVDHSILELIPIEKKEPMSRNEIIERCLLVFLNETARCLDDGILSSPIDGDIGAVFGLGFPPFWGGPFKYVDLVGSQEIVRRLIELEQKLGERFQPAQCLVQAATQKTLFFPKEPVKNQL